MNNTNKKRIVICCDGTWNEPGKTQDGVQIRTNVQKTFESICNLDKQNVVQLKYYSNGVGTTGSALRRIIDGATGFGLDENIINAYQFLVWNYVQGDEIYLFGFSRGAYTARSISGLIRNCGIIKNDDLTLVKKAYNYYRDPSAAWAPGGKSAIEFRQTFSRETNIKFIGVWDTVGALGIPFAVFNLYNRRKYHFHDTELSSYVDNAFHALAIDEHRLSFEPTLWIQQANTRFRNPGQVLEQRWFPGVHSNIGGGYINSGISDLAFDWMINKAIKTGLAFEDTMLKSISRPDALNGVLYDSRSGIFKLLPKLTREINKLSQYNQFVDSSAFYKWHKYTAYRPENLAHVNQDLEKFGSDSPWSRT